jgi:hypothetical protein
VAVARRLLPLVLYAALAVVTTWPLTLRLTTAIADLGDPLLNVFILDWDCHALLHAPLSIFDAPVFYPAKYPLAYSENLIAVAAAVLPFHLAGVPPIGVYNIALLLGLTLSAYAGYVLARMLTGEAAALLAGALYGFVPYKWSHLQHLQIVWSLWPPLLLAGLIAYRRAPSWRRASLIGAVIVLSAMTNMYYLIFGLVALGLTLALVAIAERRDARFWMRLGVAVAVALVALIPILRPYAVVSKLYEMRRGWYETLGGSATPKDWLIAAGRSAVLGPVVDPEARQNERELFPGVMLVGLAIVACCRLPVARGQTGNGQPATGNRIWLDALIALAALATYIGMVHPRMTTKFPATLLVVLIVVRQAPAIRRGLAASRFPLELWMAALWIVIGFLGSLGLNAFFHSFLFQYVAGVRATRVPARWAMIAYAGLVPWAACGVAAAASAAGARSGRRYTIVALIAALALVDIWPSVRWEMAPVENAPVDRWIAETKAGPLFFLPIERLNLLYEYMFRDTLHHQPIMNAISGFEPPLHRALRSQPLTDLTLDRLEQNGYRFVVVRPDWAGPGVLNIYPWLQRNLANGRLAFVRRFDYAINGDWVFAITRVEKTRGQETEDLRRLFAGQPVRSSSTFGQMFRPAQQSEVRGPLEVSGWALSPDGIREVNILIDAGRHKFRAPLFAREDVSKLFPWYPRTPRPAFALVIPARPPGVPRGTDVQVEIIDGAGRVTRLRDALITWE